MKSRRILPIAGGFACVILVLAFYLIITADVKHASTEGEGFSIAGLASSEEVVVSTLIAHRTATGREYRIRSTGPRRTVAIFDTTPTWSREDGSIGAILLCERDLTESEIAGLDETIAYFREVREEDSSATREVRLRYFRDGKQVGEEFFIGFSLTSQLTYFDQQGMRFDPAFQSDYERLATDYRVSWERLNRIVPFESLEKERPNKSAQPTPGSVTPRASSSTSK